MPEPPISSQPVPLHSRQVERAGRLPWQRKHEASTSAEGSVKGKKLGRRRIPVSGPKKRWTKAMSVAFRSSKLTFLSTCRPSHCGNIGVWVASSSRRKTLPGAMIFTGGGPASMVRICTGEVCERRMRPPSTKKVSCMSRAGWSGGVLSASKLFHSVSISGPVRTSKPMPRKISSISMRTRVSGCSVPARRPRPRQGDVHAAGQIGPHRRAVGQGRQPVVDQLARWCRGPGWRPRPPRDDRPAECGRAASSARSPCPSCPGSAPARGGSPPRCAGRRSRPRTPRPGPRTSG